MGCFWPKYIIFEIKKYRGVEFDGIEDWYKIWMKIDLRNLVNFQQSTRKSQNWDFDGILLSEVENVWT